MLGWRSRLKCLFCWICFVRRRLVLGCLVAWSWCFKIPISIAIELPFKRLLALNCHDDFKALF